MLQETMACCKEYRHEFVMPEHLLFVLTDEFNFNKALNIFYSVEKFAEQLEEKLEDVETVPEDKEYEPEASVQMGQVIEFACQQVVNSSAKALDLPHLVMGILSLKDSWACFLLKDALGDKEGNFMSELISFYEFDDHLEEETGEGKHEAAWRRLVTCMNELYQQHNPLIGREQELERTIQVLCRRDKNTPLHVGEPGVDRALAGPHVGAHIGHVLGEVPEQGHQQLCVLLVPGVVGDLPEALLVQRFPDKPVEQPRFLRDAGRDRVHIILLPDHRRTGRIHAREVKPVRRVPERSRTGRHCDADPVMPESHAYIADNKSLLIELRRLVREHQLPDP